MSMLQIISRNRNKRRRGIALIIVLASLVLLTILILAFLAGVGTDLQSSKFYANGSSVKLLAQSSVNLVMGEIRDATANGSLCWASQPGMIRTYDNTGYNANVGATTHSQYYKLYSDSNMVGTGPFDITDPANAVPANWYSQKGVYVDLNQPVAINGVDHYPILDGDLSANDLIASGASWVYGPLNTTTSDPQVAGFSINNTATPKAPVDATAPNHAPMPVKWLYVLKKGQVIAPDTGTTGTVTFSGSVTPDKTNPIVGRMAFWTDDETCKININTASEGSAVNTSVSPAGTAWANISSAVWDTPRFWSDYDVNFLSANQPVQREFQRYPGHPATISLSAVFNNLISDSNFPQDFYPITPRIIAGGSKQGTVKIPVGTAVPSLRTTRLYSSVDEFLFQPTLTSGSRTPNSTLVPAIDANALKRASFFITANSRAPDVNVFNQPRISLWPISINANTTYRSAADQLIAFCTTLNKNIYYFQRQDPTDPFLDLPNPAATTTSYTDLRRNRQLLEYLRYLTSQQIPGFGGSFASKYNQKDLAAIQSLGDGIDANATDRDQILTEIFDYIRSTNTVDQSTSPAITPYAPVIKQDSSYYFSAGRGQVVPIVDAANGTRGFGRFPTLQQAALIFYPCKDTSGTVTQVKSIFVVQLADPSLGYPWSYPFYTIKISGLSALTWDGTQKIFAAEPATIQSPYNGGQSLEPMNGGIIGWKRFFYGNFNLTYNYFAFDANGNLGTGDCFGSTYPSSGTLASNAITSIKFGGGPITVTFYKNNSDGSTSSTVIQTLHLTLPSAPSAGFPLPSLPTGESTAALNAAWGESWSTRISETTTSTSYHYAGGYGTILGDNDVVRAVIASPGDTRLVAARYSIPANTGANAAASLFFDRHPLWTSTSNKKAHALRTGQGFTYYGNSYVSGAGGGRLVPLSYKSWQATPYLSNTEASGLNALMPWDSDVTTQNGVFVGGSGTIPGDWDNGVGVFRDGPYINKADEGDKSDTSPQKPYYYDSQSNLPGPTFFSPNREIPSAAMFGSLPSGVLENKPWQTLLFRPGPKGHPGLGTSIATGGDVGPPYSTTASTATTTSGPPDHLLLDLFTMPVVEPYAISEPLSTAGRINMNYQIIPFTYINRTTGIQAALKSVHVISVPDTDSATYKTYTYLPTTATNYRLNIDIAKTLLQFDARMTTNKDLFRSPSEICSIDLVPSDYTGATTSPGTSTWRTNLDTYWNASSTAATDGHRLTGDNSRERPYADLYPLLTTKSNTFTIHFRVQTLKPALPPNAPAASWTTWREGTDVITSEYRGSQMIERYVDPNDSTLPDFAAAPSVANSLASNYRFRVLSTKQFSP